MKNNNPILKNASAYVFNLFKEKLNGEYVYHSYRHTADTVKACKELAESYNLSSREYEVLMLAAWFHDTGYTDCYNGHEEKSVAILKDYLQGEYRTEDLAEIEALILSTKFNSKIEGKLQEILHDADYINIGKKKFSERAELLRIEWEQILDKKFSDSEWAEEQLNFLIGTTFKTEAAILNYNTQREINIREQRNKVEELKIADQKQKAKIAVKEESKPKKEGRGIETLYRSVYAYHINLSSLADNKANIMISINTIIISLIITLFGSGYTFSSNDGEFESIRFVFPMVILLFSSLTAVVFAILSARPTVTSKEKYDLNNKKSSVLFFGNFSQLQLDEFVSRIKALKKEKEELYDSMSIDIYSLGAVLLKKYRLLTWSYNIFMGGLILSAVGFIILMIVSYDA
ncbi:Pycsar system effector family protein [Rubrolithibacter danxiaensis]|uniref:Pycsar system effector family protein n=1 Tax=Rubrolithibacter danxiaensis TaxID=3390805 RepID=UPI003BF896CB